MVNLNRLMISKLFERYFNQFRALGLTLPAKLTFMQRILLVLNIILLAAVLYLFVDKFSGPSNDSAAPSGEVMPNSSGPLKIAYVNVDTLLNNYTLFLEKQKAISAREQEEDAKLRSRGKSLEREIMALQQKAGAGTMTPKDLQLEEGRLAKKQQEFLADQERISRQLMEETTRINDELQAEIVKAIQGLKATGEYDFVLSYGAGSPVLAVNDKLNITDLVLTKLNEGAPVQ